jgi:hypothetical protein
MIAKTLITNAFKDLGIRFLDLDQSTQTGEDIVSAALRKITIKAANTPLTATEISDGLELLNDMLASWKYDGIDLFTTSVTQSDPSNLPTWSLSGVKSSLAVRYASEYGKPVTESLANEMQTEMAKLQERTSPVNLEDGLQVLNSLVLELDAKGTRLGYLNPQGESEETGLPDWSIPYIRSTLAIRLAPLAEKQVNPALAAINRDARKNFYSKTARTPVASLPSTLPIGSGNEKYTYQTHHYSESPELLGTDVDSIDTGEDVDISLSEDTRYVEQ